MVCFGDREKNLEIAFMVTFSILVYVFFFFLLGTNGLVLGNDSAVHLETAKYFLSTNGLPPSSILWLPPLYQLALATFISFTGATSVDQQLILVKAVTALMDWLLVFSVYLLAAKFFSKKTGILASSLLLLSFPLYELNSWGGYTSVLGLAFMALLFVYLATPLKSAANAFVAFVLTFSIVLTHQLAAFLLLFILPPFIILILIKSKGTYPKALIAAIVGGAIAFGIYYLGPLLPYLGSLVSIVFFGAKTMLYQIPSVNWDAFMMYFGVIFLLSFAGLAISFFELKKRKSLSFYLLLILAFAVPLFFSQSYLVGFLLPFQWFVYYLLPALTVLAAVSLSLLIDVVLASYFNNRRGWKRIFFKAVSVGIIVVFAAAMVVHFQTLSGKLAEDTAFYASSDKASYQAGLWLRQNNVDSYSKVVVSQKPGHWFWVYSGLNLIGETDPIVDWNVNAESVLDLSYEMANPLTMVRVYEAKSGISDENYALLNMVWARISYSTEDMASLSFRDENNTLRTYALSSLNRSIAMDEVNYPKSISVNYLGDEFVLSENILVSNNSYPITITWRLSALNGDLTYVNLYLNYYFDSKFSFDNAYIPGILSWQNPWSNPSRSRDGWAVTDFSAANLTTDNHVSVYDAKNQVAFGLQFDDLPFSGTVGVLANKNIDAVRFEYQFYKVNANFTVSKTYQLLTFSKSSLPKVENLTWMNSMFDYKTAEAFTVDYRNFASIIRDNYIGYIVYDVQRFDPSILKSKWVELVYSNNKYVVLKIRSDHPYPNVLEKTSN